MVCRLREQLALRLARPRDTEFTPWKVAGSLPQRSEMCLPQRGLSRGSSWMLRRRAVPSPDQGSHSFSQIENQPWGSRPLIEAASDCCCSNYSCVVPLGPAGPCRTHSPALNSGLRTITGGGGRRGRAYLGSCWGLSEPSKCTGSDHGVTDVEA